MVRTIKERVALGAGVVGVAFCMSCLGCELHVSSLLYELHRVRVVVWGAFCAICVALGTCFLMYKLPWVQDVVGVAFYTSCFGWEFSDANCSVSCLLNELTQFLALEASLPSANLPWCKLWCELPSVQVALGASCLLYELLFVRVVVWFSFCAICFGCELPWVGVAFLTSCLGCEI